MRRGCERGFSVIEMSMAVMVSLIIAAISIPSLVGAQRKSRLRGAATDFTGMIESERIYAIRDNRFYSVYLLTFSGAPSQAYIDMFPQSSTGASGNGGTSIVGGNPGVSGDPVIVVPAEVTQQVVANAPSTTNLQNQLLPSNTNVTPTDAVVTPITFSPRGLPCTPLPVTGGTVCDSAGGPVAYWTFFQDSASTEWEAVTVTPAGKIAKWYYSGTAWKSF